MAERELLDVIEFAEGALLDYVAREDGLSVDAAWTVLEMCSEALAQHGRTSVLIESGKKPDS